MAEADNNGAIAGGTGEPQWYSSAESLKTSDPEVWSSFEKGVQSGSIKDLPSLIKKGIGAEKMLGGALVPPGKDARPEDIAAFKEKLYATGHIAKPAAFPESADKYELKLDTIPENLRLPELLSEFQGWAHKHGMSNEAANELMALNAKQFTAASQQFEGSRQEAEGRIAELAKRDGRDMNAVMEGGKRAAETFLKESPKTLEKLNLYFGNDPDIMYALSKMGEAMGEDASQTGGGAGGGTADPVAEAVDIVKNPANPKHKMFWEKDPATVAHVNALYDKKYPGTQEI